MLNKSAVEYEFIRVKFMTNYYILEELRIRNIVLFVVCYGQIFIISFLPELFDQSNISNETNSEGVTIYMIILNLCIFITLALYLIFNPYRRSKEIPPIGESYVKVLAIISLLGMFILRP